jgi:hypothetical protein
MIVMENRSTPENPAPVPFFSTKSPTPDPVSNPDLGGGRPVTNRKELRQGPEK